MRMGKRSMLKAAVVMAAFALVAAACGSSEPGGATTEDATEAATPAAAAEEVTTDDAPDVPEAGSATASAEVEIVPVSLPDGLRPWWESANRSAPFGGEVFLLAASSDVAIGGEQRNLQILRLDLALQ